MRIDSLTPFAIATLLAIAPLPALAGDQAVEARKRVVVVQGEDAGAEPAKVSKKVVVVRDDDEGGEPMVWVGGDDDASFAFSSAGFASGAYLGVQLLDVTPELLTFLKVPDDAGVLVSKVLPDSPAEKAGVHVGDVITSVDGDAVDSSFDLSAKIASHEPNERVDIEVFRNGRAERHTAELGERKGRGHAFDPVFGVGPKRRLFVTGSPDEETIETIEERVKKLAGPGAEFELRRFRSDTKELEEKLEKLEAQLAEMSKKLEAISKKK